VNWPNLIFPLTIRLLVNPDIRFLVEDESHSATPFATPKLIKQKQSSKNPLQKTFLWAKNCPNNQISGGVSHFNTYQSQRFS
jgi:hypothetical protein